MWPRTLKIAVKKNYIESLFPSNTEGFFSGYTTTAHYPAELPLPAHMNQVWVKSPAQLQGPCSWIQNFPHRPSVLEAAPTLCTCWARFYLQEVPSAQVWVFPSHETPESWPVETHYMPYTSRKAWLNTRHFNSQLKITNRTKESSGKHEGVDTSSSSKELIFSLVLCFCCLLAQGEKKHNSFPEALHQV